jgi:hypothetical protein
MWCILYAYGDARCKSFRRFEFFPYSLDSCFNPDCSLSVSKHRSLVHGVRCDFIDLNKSGIYWALDFPPKYNFAATSKYYLGYHYPLSSEP